MTTPRILIIAGSDSGGGAGIQADIKTVTMLGGHAMTAITAITAQNTLGVSAVMPVPAEMVLQQIDAVVSDIGVDAIKIGMIGSAETAQAVAERLEGLDVPIVFDPVMIASSGSVLADEATIAAFGHLMRLATVTTPNRMELEALAGFEITEELSQEQAAHDVMRATGCRALLAKGGHAQGIIRYSDGSELRAEDRVFDLLYELSAMGFSAASWDSTRIGSMHDHGTGCTLAAAIAIYLARGCDIGSAIGSARRFVRFSLLEAPKLGAGHGPMGQQAVRLDVPVDARPVLNQITLPASDYEASVAFYGVVGFEQIVASPPRYARFEAAGGMTLSIEVGEPASPPSPTEYFLQCADLEETVQRLEQAGISFPVQPEDRSYGWRVAETRDPHGNRICLYDPGENRRFPPWRISGNPGSSGG